VRSETPSIAEGRASTAERRNSCPVRLHAAPRAVAESLSLVPARRRIVSDAGRRTLPLRLETRVIILGIILIVLGYVAPVPAFVATIGWILLVVGLILTVLGAVGRPMGRKTYF
jgi:hypothetical protein